MKIYVTILFALFLSITASANNCSDLAMKPEDKLVCIADAIKEKLNTICGDDASTPVEVEECKEFARAACFPYGESEKILECLTNVESI